MGITKGGSGQQRQILPGSQMSQGKAVNVFTNKEVNNSGQTGFSED